MKISHLLLLLVACGFWARSRPTVELRLVERELGYDLFSIQGVRPGMEQSKVIGHLGRPLKVEQCLDGEIWNYQPDYKEVTVFIGRAKVQAVSGLRSGATVDGYSLQFLDPEHVRSIFGPPTSVSDNLWFYRLNHRELAILFEAGGVTRVTLSRI